MKYVQIARPHGLAVLKGLCRLGISPQGRAFPVGATNHDIQWKQGKSKLAFNRIFYLNKRRQFSPLASFTRKPGASRALLGEGRLATRVSMATLRRSSYETTRISSFPAGF
eukprot:6456088-Amphidinium_carterae.1